MLILVDQDGVLADYDAGFDAAWATYYPFAPRGLATGRPSFYMEDAAPTEWREHVHPIQKQPGFFRNLPVIPGAPDGINALLDAGHDVRICTAPLSDHPACLSEKAEWVNEHLGPAWVKRMIFTRDKSVITADVLIDDRPDAAHGAITPAWTHIFYTQSYNTGLPGWRLTWDTAPAVIAAISRHRRANQLLLPTQQWRSRLA